MKICAVTLGCPKNVVDSEYLLAGLKNEHIQIVNRPHEADVVIINTCAFILPAREEAVKSILEAVQLKQDGRIQRVYVTGCFPQRYLDELKREIPEVDAFFPELDFRDIARRISQELNLPAEGVRSIRELQMPNHYAYLKISEGCDNRCHYCTIPLIKGNFRSFDEQNILSEATELIVGGVKEIIVIAQDTTYYGWDRGNRFALPQLIRRLAEIESLAWIRLLYAHPAHFTEELISLFGEVGTLCRYIDLPIQHISNKMLKSMGRRVTEKQVRTLIETLRSRVPEIAIRTTLLVGYPGETENDFLLLKEFIREAKFERLGVFKYSSEEGTPAFTMSNQVDEQTKDERLDELMKIQYDIACEQNEKLIGKTVQVIIDEIGEDNNTSYGRTQWDTPLIDNMVHLNERMDVGSIVPIRITHADAYDVWGERIT